MRAGYRKFFMFGQVAILIGIGYLMTRFWEEAKNQCELYNLPQKLWVILGMMFICGIVSWGSVDALTRIYIHKWGMELAFLGKIIFSLTYQNKKIAVCFFQHIIHLLAL